MLLAQKIGKFALDEYEQRFPSLRIIEDFELFDFAKLRENKPETITQNTERLSRLIAFYYPITLGQGMRNLKISNDIKIEWKGLIDILTNDKHVKKLKDGELASYFVNILWDLYPNLGDLYERCITTPLNSAICERCFSKLGNIKTKLRNQLMTETVDHLLRITSTESDRLKTFDLSKPYILWSEEKKRTKQLVIKTT
jgi:hypothetical protein